MTYITHQNDLKADVVGRACWLVSSNISNEGFYNSHGFKSVGEVVLGADNPDWHEGPVRVQVVSDLLRIATTWMTDIVY
jgi:hypothetical protein